MHRKYRIRHETIYRYDADVVHAHHLLHLVPRPMPYQECLDHQVSIEPPPNRQVAELDAFGNPLLRVELAQPHRELNVVSQMQVEVHTRPAVSAETTEPWETVRDAFAYRGAWPSRDQLEAARFRHESPHVRVKQAFTDYSAGCFGPGTPILVCAETLSTKLHADITYAPGETVIGTAATEVLETRRGVCQDFAHLLVALARSLGLPARYVSGYFHDPAQPPDATLASHAWAELFLESRGWLGLDPTHNCPTGPRYVRVAIGRDYADAAPMRGIYQGTASEKLAVRVRMHAADEQPALR